MNKETIITFLEAFYIIYMWNFFKTKYSVHNIWEAPLMNYKEIPGFFKHNINTNNYESKICPLGNVSGYALAIWIILRDIGQFKKNKIMRKLNKVIFLFTAVVSFTMNLNSFIYLLPIYYYELVMTVKYLS